MCDNRKISWEKFKKKFISFGGKDGIYAASQVLSDEPIIKKLGIGKCYKNCHLSCVKNCTGTPVAKKLQKQLLLFTTNQTSLVEINKQVAALKKTIDYFKWERLLKKLI